MQDRMGWGMEDHTGVDKGSCGGRREDYRAGGCTLHGGGMEDHMGGQMEDLTGERWRTTGRVDAGLHGAGDRGPHTVVGQMEDLMGEG